MLLFPRPADSNNGMPLLPKPKKRKLGRPPRARQGGRVRVPISGGPIVVRRARTSTPSQGSLAMKDETVTLPLSFFMEPLRLALARPIRPPTASTRRRQRVVEMAVPMPAFFALLRPFETGDLEGLEWTDQTKTGLKPTSSRVGCNTYKYDVRRPAQLNQLWDMASWDRKVAGTPWRRGHGAQRLHLTQAAGRRGQRTMLVSSACGNVSLRCREYQDKLPVLRVVFSVMTLDEKNHILWNQGYSATTRAALRNMVAVGLAKMASGQLVSNADSGARAVGDDFSAAAEHDLAAGGGDNDGDGSSCARRRRLDSSSAELSATTFALSNNVSPPPCAQTPRAAVPHAV